MKVNPVYYLWVIGHLRASELPNFFTYLVSVRDGGVVSNYLGRIQENRKLQNHNVLQIR